MLSTTKARTIGTTWLLVAAVTLCLALAAPVIAQGPEQGGSTSELKVPQTAKDHYEMAEYYRKKQAEALQDIQMHKKMLADFSKGVATTPKAGENPYIKEMRLHCEKYIKAAEALAADAAESAKFHTHRAKEMEGK